MVEVLLAVSVFALLVTALVGAYLYGEEATALAGNRARAVLLAEEALEAARNIRDAAFINLTNGTFGFATTSNQWNLNGSPLANGALADGTVVSGATTTTLTLTNVHIPDTGSSLTCTVSNTLDGYNVAASSLATNSLPVSATSSAATLTISDPYLTFIAGYGLSYNGNGAPTADPDGDGVANQLEQFLGRSPTSPDANGQPSGTVENNQFVLRFTRAKLATAAYAAETSTDLLVWSPLAVTVEASTVSTETLVASIPLTAPKQFVRLNVAGVTTVPLGYLKATLPTGATTAFGLPLDGLGATPIGLRAAKIETLTATTLTQSLRAWTGNLANPAAPWALRLTSGAAAGKLLDLAANTTTSLTVTGADLLALGVVPGDTFELVPLDTLGTLFGAGTFQGGTSSANADVVQLRSGTAWLAFYYDTTLGFWRRTSGTATNANNVVLRPGAALLVLRRAASLTLTFPGRVLGTAFRTPVNNAGTTGTTTGFPTDTTLAGLALQTRLPGWRAGTATATADSVGLYSGTAWVPYLYNGSNWQTAAGVNADALSLPAGTVLLLQRPGATAGTTDLTYNKPY